MDLSLRALRYFVITAEEGSITRAAERLYISQPSVSSALDQLERQLGQSLFVRLPARGVVLTATGAALLYKARALLDRSDDFIRAAGVTHTTLTGTLRCACFVNIAPVYFAHFLHLFNAAHPSVKVKFRELNHDDVLKGIFGGDEEIGMTFDLGGTAGLDVTELAELRPHAVLSGKHPLASSSTIRLEQLVDDNLILMDLPHTRDYFLSLFTRMGLTPKLEHLTTSFEMARALAGNDHGYALLSLTPKSPQTYDGHPVVHIPLADPVPPLKIVLLKLRAMPHRKITEVFYTSALQYFKHHV